MPNAIMPIGGIGIMAFGILIPMKSYFCRLKANTFREEAFKNIIELLFNLREPSCLSAFVLLCLKTILHFYPEEYPYNVTQSKGNEGHY